MTSKDKPGGPRVSHATSKHDKGIHGMLAVRKDGSAAEVHSKPKRLFQNKLTAEDHRMNRDRAIFTLRVKNGWTTAELSSAFNIDRTTVWRIIDDIKASIAELTDEE